MEERFHRRDPDSRAGAGTGTAEPAARAATPVRELGDPSEGIAGERQPLDRLIRPRGGLESDMRPVDTVARASGPSIWQVRRMPASLPSPAFA
jgi:hypothetical protein